MRVIIGAMLVTWLAVAGAGTAAAQGSSSARILAIGDSLLTWNRLSGRSIPQVVSAILKEPVQSRAQVGAHVIYNLPVSGALGKRISAQFQGRPWDWVLVSGGGNDLWLGCGCTRCQRRMARMIAPDGQSGKIPDLVREIRATGAQVIYIGYLTSPGYTTIIDHCRNEGRGLDGRLAVMAKHMPGVHYLSMADLVPHGDMSFHSTDGIHPSKKGSIEIAKRVVRQIRAVDPRR